MSFVKYFINSCIRTKDNLFFYLNKRKEITKILNEFGYTKIQPFMLYRWHHNLTLFTAYNTSKNKVFIKLSSEKGILKNENNTYKELEKNDFLKNHIILREDFIVKNSFNFLILKHSEGTVLSEDWMFKNPHELQTLIRIVDEFCSISLVHRDIKLDNFIFENGKIKIFDFTFMIDKINKEKISEIDLSTRHNVIKLLDLGINYKPDVYKWDDYYSLYIVFDRFLENYKPKLSDENKHLFTRLLEECKEKIDSNSYSILR